MREKQMETKLRLAVSINDDYTRRVGLPNLCGRRRKKK